MNKRDAYPLGRFISLRHSSAVTTRKGRLSVCFKKCLFSVTRASAPTHSAYAEIKASASLNPKASYFAPRSKGTTKSSSISASPVTKVMKFLLDSGERLRLTSSVISRGSRIEWRGYSSRILLSSERGVGSIEAPKANMYSFESRTSSNLLVPKLFSRLTDRLYCLFLGHAGKRLLTFGRKLT